MFLVYITSLLVKKVDSKGTEYLVPFVDYYIDTVIDNLRCVILQNAVDLVALYKVEAKKK